MSGSKSSPRLNNCASTLDLRRPGNPARVIGAASSSQLLEEGDDEAVLGTSSLNTSEAALLAVAEGRRVSNMRRHIRAEGVASALRRLMRDSMVENQEALLFSYPILTTSDALVSSWKENFRAEVQREKEQLERGKPPSSNPPPLRMIRFMQLWLDAFAYELEDMQPFRDAVKQVAAYKGTTIQVYERLRDRIQQLELEKKQKPKPVLLLLEQDPIRLAYSGPSTAVRVHPDDEAASESSLNSMSSFRSPLGSMSTLGVAESSGALANLGDLLSSGAGSFLFSAVYSDPKSIAAHLTELAYALYERLSFVELVNQVWKSERAVGSAAQRMIARYNEVSNWVVTVVLATESARKRVQVIETLIRVAHELVKLRNFETAAAISGGLSVRAVERLRQTWAEVPQRRQNALATLQLLFSGKNNWRMYREKLAVMDAPAVPLLCVALKDIVALKEGNDLFLGDGVVNVDLLLMLARSVRMFFRFKHAVYKPSVSLQEPFLELLKDLDGIEDEDMHFDMSAAIEPLKSSLDSTAQDASFEEVERNPSSHSSSKMSPREDDLKTTSSGELAAWSGGGGLAEDEPKAVVELRKSGFSGLRFMRAVLSREPIRLRVKHGRVQQGDLHQFLLPSGVLGRSLQLAAQSARFPGDATAAVQLPYDMGFVAGVARYQQLCRLHSLSTHVDTVAGKISAGLLDLASSGWAHLKLMAKTRLADQARKFVVHLETARGTCTLEAQEPWTGRGVFPGCWLLCGLLAGWMTGLTGFDRLACTETRCRARGDDSCHFLLASASILKLLAESDLSLLPQGPRTGSRSAPMLPPVSPMLLSSANASWSNRSELVVPKAFSRTLEDYAADSSFEAYFTRAPVAASGGLGGSSSTPLATLFAGSRRTSVVEQIAALRHGCDAAADPARVLVDDPMSGSLTVGADRVGLLPMAALGPAAFDLCTSLSRKGSDSLYTRFTFRAGLVIGVVMGKVFGSHSSLSSSSSSSSLSSASSSVQPPSHTLDSGLEIVSQMLMYEGFGRLGQVQASPCVDAKLKVDVLRTLRMERSPIALAHRDRQQVLHSWDTFSRKLNPCFPVCSFLCGVLSGFFSAYLKDVGLPNVLAVECSCFALRDATCDFVLVRAVPDQVKRLRSALPAKSSSKSSSAFERSYPLLDIVFGGDPGSKK